MYIQPHPTHTQTQNTSGDKYVVRAGANTSENDGLQKWVELEMSAGITLTNTVSYVD
jgi:hypothetical protein